VRQYRVILMRRRFALLAVLLFPFGGTVAAQAPTPLAVWGEVFPGSELESYLRVLQTLGRVPLYPWGLRSLSHGEIARLTPPDTGHPWARRYDFSGAGLRVRLGLVRPAATLRVNSTFPYGGNDGPVWAGRGLTSALEAGVTAGYGPLSLTVAPLAFRAENDGFGLMATGDTGRLGFADGFFPGIDAPQRFGARPYTLLDPGASTLRVDAGGVAAGVSTANEYWGPTREFPILLGNNAAGFTHVFLGTAAPVDLRVLRLHTRLLWGRPSQSDYSPETKARGLRFGVGGIAVLTSRFVPGLELGVARFAHRPWRPGGPTIDDLLIPLRSQFGANVAGTAGDNQLAAVFFRWVLPRSGFEAYGEYGRDDYNQNSRDFVLEPDHIGGYTIGFARATLSGGAVRVVRAEIQNLQFSVLAQGRGWAPFYTSGSLGQGHTQRGQVLGSYAGTGGAGALVALDTYHAGGRWTVSWSRVLRRQRGGFASTGQVDLKGLDVMHMLSANALFFRGRYDIAAGVTAVYEFNRDFGRDAVNLNATLGVRAAWR
jgi:hypothetical protein